MAELIIRNGKVLSAPPVETNAPSLDYAVTSEQLADEDARRRRYQDEVDSAERLRRQQEMEMYFQHGLRPPAFTSEFAPESSAEIMSRRPRFMNVRGDLYDVTTGIPRLAVDSPEPPVTRQPIWDFAGTANIPLGEGMQWVYGPSGYVQQPIPKKGIEEIFGGLTRGGLTPPAASSNAINPKSASTKRPTRAQAAQFVNQYGKANAVAELQKQGFDTSGYAD